MPRPLALGLGNEINHRWPQIVKPVTCDTCGDFSAPRQGRSRGNSGHADPSDSHSYSAFDFGLMLATRNSLFVAAWITCGLGSMFGTGVAQGQTPLSDPGHALHVTDAVPITSPSNATWTPPAEVHVEDPLHPTTMHTETEVPAACACGQARCPGVCRDPGRPEKPWIDRPGDRDRGDCPPYRYSIPDCKRAGNPHCVAPWAVCSVNKKYSAWFVGGGAAFWRGRCRKPTEGTWGLDYSGFFGHANVWLKYTRGRKQGGEGAYETDGEPEFVARAHELLPFGH